MFGLRRFFDPRFKAARGLAMRYVVVRHPTWAVTDACLRAEEPTRYVFAVFYEAPNTQVLPGRYILIAVARHDDSVEQLDTSPESRYWIRGRR
jgi:hypothetical protein